MNIDFQQLKTFSVLSETPQYIDHGAHNRYVSYLGYVFTYSTFSTLLMWAMCGPKLYYTIWTENTQAINQLKSMNSHDLAIESLTGDGLAYYFINKIKQSLNDLKPEDVEKLLNQMFEFKHS